ncbi:MAG: alanine racemase [Clostridiales bacterium]|nr:alanine racemase [Clostridiales bacterium]
MIDRVQRYGTPLYYFDGEILRDRICFLRKHIPEATDLCYAVKANPFLIKEAAPYVDRLEVCSPGEARICFDQQVPEEKMVISGVYKDPDFMQELVQQHPLIGWYTVESMSQYQLLTQLARTYGRKLKLLPRLSSGMQFGMDEKEITGILEAPDPEVEICGLQFFSGTQKTSLKKMRREMEKSSRLVRAFGLQELEFGTGFPVFYFADETFDEEAYLQGFRALLEEYAEGLTVTLELGRSITASCGTYYTTVVDTKQIGSEKFAIVDGGIHQIAYYGQFMAMKLPCMRLLPERKADAEPWNICGSLCTVNDILVKEWPTAPLSQGDVLAFEKAGAYCVTEGIALFLSRDLPAVVLKSAQDGKEHLLRAHVETNTLNEGEY